MRASWRVAAATVVFAAGCHLALGLESAEVLDTTSEPVVECESAAECDDDNPCTVDACNGGLCSNAGQDGNAPAALQIAGDCKNAVCQGGALEQLDDDSDPPIDGIACTEDRCALGEPRNPPSAGGTPCATGVCDGGGNCVECFTSDACETPDTCGGGGTPFACGCTPDTCEDLGLTCGNAPNGCVGALNCNTNAKDGDESGIDCGGALATCPRRCGDGQTCDVPSDCASNVCTAGLCVGN